jgi:hypothetical protein
LLQAVQPPGQLTVLSHGFCALFALGLCLGCARGEDVGAARASEIVTALYSETAGAPVDAFQAREEGPFYRVTVAVRGTRNFQDVLLTRDGQRVAEQVVVVEDERRKLAEDRRFVDCLLEHKVTLLGAPGTLATEEQLRIIGRSGHRLLVRCDLEPENCTALGARALPSILADRKAHDGLRTRAWLESLTGCK